MGPSSFEHWRSLTDRLTERAYFSSLCLQPLLVQATLEDLWCVTMLQACYATSSAWKHSLPPSSTLFCYYFRSLASPFPSGLRFVTFFQHLMASTEQVDVAVTLHSCIREMHGSTPRRGISYPDWGFSWLSSVPPGKSWNRPRLFLSEPFRVHHTSQSYTSIASLQKIVVK
jgi:hypothetical protein